MLEQDFDNCLTGCVVLFLQTELFEAFILADQIGWRIWQEIKKAFKVGLLQRIFQIFGNVDLDAALLQNFERCPGLPSTGVVVHFEFFHRYFLPTELCGTGTHS